MPPKKKLNSASKKSNQNSQPSKFGIQHFFHRHTLSQNHPKTQQTPGPNTNKLQIPTNGSLPPEKCGPITTLSAAPNSKKIALDSAVRNPTNDSRTTETTNSQNTPPENCLPAAINAGENQSEVSPEICKSVSVKRFKFSPGMVIHFSPPVGLL